ncbi:MAG: hypothetical protein ACLQJR_19225 [Stellaceae bacterium]
MAELTSNQAIARIAPGVFEHFHGRGLIDFRVFPNKPKILFVYVHFFCEQTETGDLDALCAVAAKAGLEVERSCLYGGTAWVEVSTRVAAAKSVGLGAVVPFLPRLRARAALA